MKHKTRVRRLSAGVVLILLATLSINALPASAATIGSTCKKGQSAKITMPVNIRVTLVCTKVGNAWKFTNADGKLHLGNLTNSVAQSQKPYRMYLPVAGGKPPYQCILGAGSALPEGFNYAHAGQVINGAWNCVIASGSVPALPSGTTKRITPPFTMTFRDTSSPVQRTSVTLSITIIASGPKVQVTAGLNCTVGIRCDVELATATGGIRPYTFRLDTMLAGAPPLGLAFGTNGHMIGIPTVAGTTVLGVCVVDATGAYDCEGADFRVLPAVQATPSGPQLSDLNGNFSAMYGPTWAFDDVTIVYGLLPPFKYTINNGQITGDITAQITWSPPDGNARVTLPLVFSGKSATCSGVWDWHVDEHRQVTLTAPLECRGASVYNKGDVKVTKL